MWDYTTVKGQQLGIIHSEGTTLGDYTTVKGQHLQNCSLSRKPQFIPGEHTTLKEQHLYFFLY